MVLGDSLALGLNPYGEKNYGYSSYLADYLLENNLLNKYVSEFAKNGNTPRNIIDDINFNKRVITNNKSINIRNILRESDLVTISIGMNNIKELIKKPIMLNNSLDKINLKNDIDILLKEISILVKEVKKYAKKDIYLIGFYNPYPYFKTYKIDVEKIINYTDTSLEKICLENNIKFIKISKVLADYLEFFPNSLDMHPNISGYEKIFIEIKKKLVI